MPGSKFLPVSYTDCATNQKQESHVKFAKLRLIAIAIMLLLTLPAYADSVVQVWNCELNDDKTFKELEAVSQAWLKAARGIKGGEEMEVYLNYAVGADEDADGVLFILVAPSFESWGAFEDRYEDSPAAEADEAFNEVASCSTPSLWGSAKIE
jgi:hypothetical protein